MALNPDETSIERNRSIANRNLEELRGFFTRHAETLEWVEPRAGVIGFPRFSSSEVNVESFCEDLVKAEGVMLLPGKYFDFDPRHFRLGFGRISFPQALHELEQFLRSHMPR